MSNTNNVYLGLVGGLGDILYGYRIDKRWQSLSSFKTNNPSSEVKAIIVSHNPSAKDIVETNPYIDIVESYPPLREMRDLGWTHSQVIAQYSGDYIPLATSERLEPNEIYLSKADKNFISKIDNEKTIVFHPFASEEARVLDPNLSLKIVNSLVDSGLKVIIIGRSYTKSFGKREEYQRLETLPDFNSSEVLNLIGQANPRIYIELIKKCKKFIGSWSCYAVGSWVHSIKSLVIVPPGIESNCKKIHDRKYKMHNKEDVVITTEEMMRAI